MTMDSVVAPSGENRTPPQEGPVGKSGRGEEDVRALDEIVCRQDAIEIIAGGEGGRAFLVVSRVKATWNGPSQASQGGRGDHALGRAANAIKQIDARAEPCGRDVWRRRRRRTGGGRGRPSSAHGSTTSSWRGRSRIITVTSLIASRLARATILMFVSIGAVMSIDPLASRPVAIFSIVQARAGLNIAALGDGDDRKRIGLTPRD